MISEADLELVRSVYFKAEDLAKLYARSFSLGYTWVQNLNINWHSRQVEFTAQYSTPSIGKVMRFSVDYLINELGLIEEAKQVWEEESRKENEENTTLRQLENSPDVIKYIHLRKKKNNFGELIL